MKRDMVHIGWKRMVEVHLEMRRWMAETHVPRKLASRVENTTQNTTLAVAGALDPVLRNDGRVRRAYQLVSQCLVLIQQLADEYFLSPHLHRWAREKLSQIEEEVVEYDENRMEQLVIRPARPPPPKVVN